MSLLDTLDYASVATRLSSFYGSKSDVLGQLRASTMLIDGLQLKSGDVDLNGVHFILETL